MINYSYHFNRLIIPSILRMSLNITTKLMYTVMILVTGKPAGCPAFLPVGRGGELHSFHIPMFDNVLQIELTIPTSLGWEFSNLSAEVESPLRDSLRSCGCFSPRIAS